MKDIYTIKLGEFVNIRSGILEENLKIFYAGMVNEQVYSLISATIEIINITPFPFTPTIYINTSQKDICILNRSFEVLKVSVGEITLKYIKTD